MRCRNCGQTRRTTLLIDLCVQIAADGRRRLPDWNLAVQCPVCDSTDVAADPARVLMRACSAGEY